MSGPGDAVWTLIDCQQCLHRHYQHEHCPEHCSAAEEPSLLGLLWAIFFGIVLVSLPWWVGVYEIGKWAWGRL